ncbi:hypothetical protein LSUB1_G007428 [Lachnellula subtilissima]|uniref:Heterokaryon incompatibility domain-containing protein n=1 Tax=Lachnellula subtilissima TaxID=602034 RepID=A0A8H8RGK0_9HELO|nr:hypothetical protein LSUB1_G007428 [Lachnellula subtilissima]
MRPFKPKKSSVCTKCKAVLDLDYLYQPLAASMTPHHKNYAAVADSARAGCPLCHLINSCRVLSSIEESLPMNSSDTLHFRCQWGDKVAFGYATLHEYERSELLDVVELTLATQHHQLIHKPWYSKLRHRDSNQERNKPIQSSNFPDSLLKDISHSNTTSLSLGNFPENKEFPGLYPGVHYRPVNEDTRSEDCFNWAKYWLDLCLNTHSCSDSDGAVSGSQERLPTRVVYVGTCDDDIRLHISDGAYGDWVTLSHCWGGVQPLKTNIANLASHCKGLDFSEIPETFRDAILITRRLGYHYLWIDSLCIIQDCPTDWDLESQQMSRVYAKGILNIAAEASKNPHQGIFNTSNENRNSYIQLPAYIEHKKMTINLYVSPSYGKSPPGLGRSVLQERAWVLQENTLSRRKLRYGKGMMWWQCKECTIPECSQSDFWSTSTFEGHWPTTSILAVPRELLPSGCGFTKDLCANNEYMSTPEEKYFKTLQWWYEQVNNYVMRQIAFQKDRFPAMSGIASEFSNRTGYHYSVGIWTEDFLKGLTWKNSLQCEIDLEHSPSWSWGVLRSPPEGRATSTLQAHIYHITNWILNEAFVTLVDLSVEKLGSDPYGQVKGAEITLYGKCCSTSYLQEASLNCGTIAMDEPLSEVKFDDPDILCLLIARFEEWGGGGEHESCFVTYGLILRPADNLSRQYQRIGLMNIKETDRFSNYLPYFTSGWEYAQITIV